MAYTKNFRNKDGMMSPISGWATNPGAPVATQKPSTGGYSNDFAFRNYQSRLPEVYTGHPNRIERYNQYEIMDVDPEINASLDILSEFSTQKNEQNGTAFEIKFNEDPTETEVNLIKKQLVQWCKLNEFDSRMFKMFRNVLKYGDQVFIRDPETFKLNWVDMTKVVKVIVNESEGKEPEQYIVRDLNFNLQNLTVAEKTTTDFQSQPPTAGYSAQYSYTAPNQPYGSSGTRFSLGLHESAIDAKHVVHLGLTEGLDHYWPFGQSVLENIFKTYKQKELLEDAILIYRVQRAPERRVFKIDVGNMPSHMAMSFVNRIKDEIHQRRIPSVHGGQSTLDATYNPLSINEDYFFPVTADGRGSSVDVLPGGQNLGEIDDLRYFNNKLARGLRIPSSYLPTGPEDSERAFVDGKVGNALIQENRFNEYCKRLQNYIIRKLNEEFKLFLRWRGFNIDSGLFDLKFNEPQNFAAYRQVEIDAQRVNLFTSISQLPYMSVRFALERFLGLTQEEIKRNEKMWHEERDEPEAEDVDGSELRSIGISTSDIESDLEMADQIPSEGAPPEGAMPPDLGAMPQSPDMAAPAPVAPAPPPPQM
jgi:hypothetical protein